MEHKDLVKDIHNSYREILDTWGQEPKLLLAASDIFNSVSTEKSFFILGIMIIEDKTLPPNTFKFRM